MSTFAARLRELMDRTGLTQAELSRKSGLSRATLSRYLQGQFEAKQDSIYKIARATNTSEAWLMGASVPMERPGMDTPTEHATEHPSNILPMPQTKTVPRLGRIACGQPILAEQNIEGYDEVPDYVKADFSLVCKGDSMKGARIYDGDIVCIRLQNSVENGEIAAVLVDNDEATLKRVRLYPDHVVLEPENPDYRPMAFWEEEMNKVRIIGKATHFISVIR